MDQNNKEFETKPEATENEAINSETEGMNETSPTDQFVEEDSIDNFDDDLTSLEDEEWDDGQLDDDVMADEAPIEDDMADEDYAESSPIAQTRGGSSGFLKNNFHYIGIGVIAVIVMIVIFNMLTAPLPGQQSQDAGFKQPNIDYNNTGVADAPNPFGGFNQAPTNPFNQPSQPEPVQQEGGLLLGDSTIVEEEVASVSESNWQKPPMPAPISPDVSDLEDKLPTGDNLSTGQAVLQSPPPSVDGRLVQRIPATGGETSDAILSDEVLTEDGVISQDDLVVENITEEIETITTEPVVESVADSDVSVSEEVVVETVDLQPVFDRLNAVDQKFQTILERLDQFDIALSEQRETSQQNQSTEILQQPDLSGIENSLASFDKKLSKITNRLSKLEKQTKAKPSAPKQPKTPVKKAEKPEPVTPQINWVLRAAQPNIAWISEGSGAPIQKVTVGQDLKGIGRVQSVRVENGRWVVRGTTGVIQQ